MRVRDLSIHTKLLSLAAVSAIGFVVFVAIAASNMKPKLEDSEYNKVVVIKDLIADVLPPPKYIIESYLALLEMSHEADAAAREELVKTWGQLKKAFDERQAYWESLPEGVAKQALERDSTAFARAFFEIGDREFIPAARAGDQAKMHALLIGSLHEQYQKHRAQIDLAVAAANKLSDAYIADAAATIENRKLRLALIGVAIAALCLLFSWLVARSISRRAKLTVEALDAVAAGDMTRQLDDDSRDDLGLMSRALNAALGSMRDALAQVQGLSQTLTSAARELASSADTIASGSHEQAASLEETAASLEELTATVRQSSDHAQEASRLATSSRDSAERGGAIVTQANAAMQQINDSSDKIGNIITTIDEIAFQTNILALNAAVEAARAGEQGRGFAVVAAQVGSLSQRSSDAAKEIKALIQDSVRRVDNGSELVDRSGDSLKEIVRSVAAVTDLVGEIAGAFREQSSGLEQISTAVAQMDQVMHSNSSQTAELSSTAADLTEQAEHLRALLTRFKITPGSAAPASASTATPAAVPATRRAAAARRAEVRPPTRTPRATPGQSAPARPVADTARPGIDPHVARAPAEPSASEISIDAMERAMKLANGEASSAQDRGFEDV